MVLGEDGTAFATDTMQIVAFKVDSGQALWTYQAAPPNTVSLIASTAGGGVVAKTTDLSGVDTIIRLDSTGMATTDPWTGSDLNYWAGNIWPGEPASGGPATGYSAGMIQTSSAPCALQNAGGAQQAAHDESVTGYSNTGQNQTTIATTLTQLMVALPSYTACNAWLQGTGDPNKGGLKGTSGSQWIGTLLQNPTLWGHATMYRDATTTNRDYGTAAFSGSLMNGLGVPGLPNPGPNNPDTTPAPLFTVNDIGFFFNATYPNPQSPQQNLRYRIGPQHYPGGDPRTQRLTLLHELAHQLAVANFHQNDANHQNLVDENDRMVDANCRSLIVGPSISSVNPNSAPVGTQIIITGMNFGQAQGASTVSFNGVAAVVVPPWNDTKIVVTVPAGATTGAIVVTVGGAGGLSASSQFTVQ